MKKLVYGVGVNDVNYAVTEYEINYDNFGNRVHKRVWTCPYYEKWTGVIERCFSSKFQEENPAYVNCSMTPEWFYLSSFIKWVDSQPNRDWRNCQLDKDLLFLNNKFYGENTSVFIPKSLNIFTTSRCADRGSYLIGVSYRQDKGKFQAQCCDPYKIKAKHIGYFNTEVEAHKAWQGRKHEIAILLSGEQEDPRVADALRRRYAPDKDWTKI